MPAIRDSALASRGLSLLLLLALWQLVVWLLQPDLLPSPGQVADRFVMEWQTGDLPSNLLATLFRVGVSFIVAMVLGLCIGALMALRTTADNLLDAPLTLGLNMPALVIIILSLLWIGLNDAAVITAVVLNKTPTMAVIFREGVRAIDTDLLEVAKVHRLTAWRRFRRVWLPQLYPYFLAATRSGLALVWKIVLVVELLGASSGMGFKLGEFFQFFEIDAVLAYAFSFMVIVMLAESLVIRPWEARVLRWRSL